MEYKPSFSDNLYDDIQPSYKDSLMHYGTKGQKWGVRRFQNPDGSLTPEGVQHYKRSKQLVNDVKQNYKNAKRYNQSIIDEYDRMEARGYRRNRYQDAQYNQLKNFVKSEKTLMNKLDSLDLKGYAYEDAERMVSDILANM